MFAPILASINLDGLPRYVSYIRQQYQYATCHDHSAATMACAVLSPPLCGSYHILFPLEFTDGLRWIIKVPVTGYRGRFDEISARALRSEALTMRFLKRETTIPIPEIYSFDASIDNELNCPYILMEFIHGVSLCESWFKPCSSLVSIEQFRANVLKDVAAAMVQLNKFRYNQSGSLNFDDHCNVTGIGPAKVVDGPAHLKSLLNDDGIYSGFFFQNGPFEDPRLCFLSALERHAKPKISQLDVKFSLGITALLRLFISWVPFDRDTEDPGFVLKHPDLDAQNVLVSEEGYLRGIIDWDGVAAVPRYIGCEQYPLWLTGDWNPHQYTYNGPDPDDPQHSPDEFAYYRSMYARFMDLCLAKEESKTNNQAQQGYPSAESYIETPFHFTRRSLLVQSLALASVEPIFTPNIVEKIFQMIEKITTSEYDSSDLDDDLQNESNGEHSIAGSKSSSMAPCDSNDEETSGMAHHPEKSDTMTHESLNKEEDSNDARSPLSIKTSEMKSGAVHHDQDPVAHQSPDEGVDDDHSSPSFLLNTFNQLSGSAQDQSKLLFLTYYLLGM